MDILKDVFQDTLEREGVNISIGSNVHKVFFRRNDKGNTIAHGTLYALYGDGIKQGEVFSLNGSKYLITNELTGENLTYRKYECIKCNATIKWMYGKNDMIIYDCYMKDLAESLKSGANTFVLNSKIEIWLPLNEDTQRIMLNGRFFCGTYKMVNKVTEFNYLNGLCYLYAERDTILPNDDAENGIANRWGYDDKPNTYTVSIAEPDIEIEQDDTQTLTVSVAMNGSTMETQPTVTWTIADGSICSVDNSNIVTGLNVGITRLTASYKVNEYDTCVTDSVMVTVKEKAVVVGDIVVTPVYNSGTYYKLLQGRTQTFTCSISGLANPQWNIALNPNGNTTSNYTSTIDNASGTFTVLNKLKSSYKLIYTISELTTNKTATYEVSMGGVM